MGRIVSDEWRAILNSYMVKLRLLMMAALCVIVWSACGDNDIGEGIAQTPTPTQTPTIPASAICPDNVCGANYLRACVPAPCPNGDMRFGFCRSTTDGHCTCIPDADCVPGTPKPTATIVFVSGTIPVQYPYGVSTATPSPTTLSLTATLTPVSDGLPISN